MEVRTGKSPDEKAIHDVLVIGSGFGGSVVAEKLAAHGKQVCVVERGKAYPPGSFPRTPGGFGGNFWDPSKGYHGLFDVSSFSGLETIVASGLGGGSLIYANVMLRKPRTWFTQPHPYQSGVYENWSFSYDDLAPHYAKVEHFLNRQELPHEPGRDAAYHVPKVAEFHKLGFGAVGVHYAPLAVQFADRDKVPTIGAPVPDAEYPNLFDVPRRTCRLCGECDVGCNEGSKNSMDHTYLSSAARYHATLHERTEVRTITRTDTGFEVVVVVHLPENETRGEKVDFGKVPTFRIKARNVVVSAGALGSTYLLLRNRERLGITNPALGTRFCGNGDLLGFILGVGRHLDGWKGPVITSYLQFPDESDTKRKTDFGLVIEDAGYPEFAAWLVESANALKRLPQASKVVAGLLWSRFRRRDSRLSDDIARLLGNPTVTVQGMPVLGMGMDVPDGTLFLRRAGDDVVLDSTWTTRTSMDYFDSLVAKMEAVAAAMGGHFKINPTFSLRRVITVHPLGGCPADTSRSVGVVDSYGRVHGVPGLWVSDGSVFPGPVGTNPSLTIAAFADRMSDQLVREVN